MIGFYSIKLRDWDCEKLFKWASEKGFEAIEVATLPGCRHLPPEKVAKGDVGEIRRMAKECGIAISGVAYLSQDYLSIDLEKRRRAIEQLKRVIDVCADLDVKTANTQVYPSIFERGRKETREKNLELMSEAFRPVVDYAKEHEVKIALENWTETLMYNPPTWDMVFEAIPDKALGLNFDPSHLVWQQIDYLEVARKFSERIYHVHAKDTEIIRSRLAYMGVMESGPYLRDPPPTLWWRFRTPGWGEIDWRSLITVLREAGYDHVLSIEHEDPIFDIEEGLVKGLKYLSKLV